MEHSDRDLVSLTLDGDPNAFEVLVERHQQRLLWLCHQMVRDWDEAADLAQEAFARCYRSLKAFDLDRNFYTWIARIAVNSCIDLLRRRERLRPMGEDGFLAVESPHDGPEEIADRRETRNAVHRVLARLPQKYRTILILKDIEGISGKEIADILDIDHQTVRWRIHQARKMFKDEWETIVDPPDPPP
ncbi:MAG: sigma-70 family RNA polymerase sigma factor [Planctomycetes bacterium]|nr:sigma-70 family RNA polymerase sigma factor [Planctomycetota bacterium]